MNEIKKDVEVTVVDMVVA